MFFKYKGWRTHHEENGKSDWKTGDRKALHPSPLTCSVHTNRTKPWSPSFLHTWPPPSICTCWSWHWRPWLPLSSPVSPMMCPQILLWEELSPFPVASRHVWFTPKVLTIPCLALLLIVTWVIALPDMSPRSIGREVVNYRTSVCSLHG